MTFKFVDSHIHLRQAGGQPFPDEHLIKGLKSHFTEGASILAMTVLFESSLDHIISYDDAALRLKKNNPDYIYPFVTPDIGARANMPEFNEIEYIRNRLEEGFMGIGEVIAVFGKTELQHPPLHVKKRIQALMRAHGIKKHDSRKGSGIMVSPKQGEIFDLAGRYHVPVIGHLWQELDDYKEFLRSHSNTKFIQAHAQNRCVGTPDNWWEWAPELLEEFDNIFLELFCLTNSKDATNGVINNDALSVLKEYPTRFLLGTDRTIVFDRACGMPIKEWAQYWKKIFSHLPKESAKNISNDNVKRLLNIS